jgi:AcrR family transcriptional regulator
MTSERLRQAACTLLAERAWSGISLRDITDRAQANVASVSYHYGSKNALLVAVLQDTLLTMTQKQAESLDALPDRAALMQVVEVWLAPTFNGPGGGVAGGWEIMRRHLDEPVPEVLAVFEEAHNLVDRSLTRRLQPLLPHLSEFELHLRRIAVLAATAALSRALPPHDSDTRRTVITTFACGALTGAPGLVD